MIVVLVALGGAVGAPLRFYCDRAAGHRLGDRFPFGTFAINVSGSFILGVLTGLSLHGHLGSSGHALFATGFCDDEAYVVAISRAPALSYFDHPPLHQWLVHGFVAQFGE